MSDNITVREQNVVNQELQGEARFEITREIAETLQGRIYGATDRRTGKTCVVKEAWKQLVHTGMSRKGHRVPENFLHERDMLMKLSRMPDAHPGLVSGIDSWDDEHCYYVAMEHCSGELFDFISKTHTKTLASVVRQKASLPQVPMKNDANDEWVNSVQFMFRQIVECVQWMHSKGVCHLDLSLENTMIADMTKKNVKLIDLGLAKEFKMPSNFRNSGRVGKLQYMCPEAYDRLQYDARKADVFCLGVMLFMMLVGAPPYPAPQKQNTAFRFCMSGRIGDVLKHWKRLRLVSEDALDLLIRIFRYEQNRISIDEILQHPFLTRNMQNQSQNNNAAPVNVDTDLDNNNSNNNNNNDVGNNEVSDRSVTASVSVDMKQVQSEMSTDDHDDGSAVVVVHDGKDNDNQAQKPMVYLNNNVIQAQAQHAEQGQAQQQALPQVHYTNAQVQQNIYQQQQQQQQMMQEQALQQQMIPQQQQQAPPQQQPGYYENQYGGQVQNNAMNVDQRGYTHKQVLMQQQQQQQPQPQQQQNYGNQVPGYDNAGQSQTVFNPFAQNFESFGNGQSPPTVDTDIKETEVVFRPTVNLSDPGLYSRLLTEWKLGSYKSNVFNFGRSDVSKWGALTQVVLTDECGFASAHANHFLQCYRQWIQTQTTASKSQAILGNLIQKFSQ